MAKTVSDNLIVRIIQKGEEKVFDLRKTFNENPNRVISTVGTVNEDGWPNTAPMSLFYCKDEKTIVAGMVRSSQTATNIRRDGRVIIEMVFGRRCRLRNSRKRNRAKRSFRVQRDHHGIQDRRSLRKEGHFSCADSHIGTVVHATV